MLVKASIAGAIVTNTLFMLGASFLLGGLEHHVQEYNKATARIQTGLLVLATVALVIPSAVAKADFMPGAEFTQKSSVGLALLLIVALIVMALRIPKSLAYAMLAGLPAHESHHRSHATNPRKGSRTGAMAPGSTRSPAAFRGFDRSTRLECKCYLDATMRSWGVP